MIIPFGSLSLVAGLIVIFCIPETMGKPLPETIEEIEDRFHPANEEMLTLSNAAKKKDDSGNDPVFVIFCCNFDCKVESSVRIDAMQVPINRTLKVKNGSK
ncbi:unnamed protein product [Acanthocheilonema viteae]|uniref:Major facilitator superfamily (MFS) profile domain-containing protein n=1 Tax=Acanthocheilonema viteae TaxID=6277 RepID=A0A498SXA6_ACAVI|nr:unnamed protein product [Acanthocheilonema viteae]